MPISYSKFCCDTYKDNLFTGFSRLQESQEFVDLTLAADNHLVKVHKNIIALASPYLKQMLQFASGQNPVIFLNNVSYKILCYLLEYIYQGEVNVPQDSIEAFIQVSKNLHITGIESIDQSQQYNSKSSNNQCNQWQYQELIKPPQSHNLPPHESNAAHNTLSNDDHNIKVGHVNENIIVPNNDKPIVGTDQSNATYYYIINGTNTQPNENNPNGHVLNPNLDTLPNLQVGHVNGNITVQNVQLEHSDMETEFAADDTLINDDANLQVGHVNENMNDQNVKPQNSVVTDQNAAPRIEIFNDLIIRPNASNPNQRVLNANLDTAPLLDLSKPIQLGKELSDALKKITQYSRSQRGCLQIIVNRYIYNSHHNSKKGRHHRWRCASYRRQNCQAFIDSFDGVITKRQGSHKHSFHDKEILSKHKDKLIFTTIEEAKESINRPLVSESAYSEGFEQTIDVNVVPNQM